MTRYKKIAFAANDTEIAQQALVELSKAYDTFSMAEADAIVLSPRPYTPAETKIYINLIKTTPNKLPILKIYLKHQSIKTTKNTNIIHNTQHQKHHNQKSQQTHIKNIIKI